MSNAINQTSASTRTTMPLSVWFFFRLVVPISPIIIQYALFAFNLYSPKFPQTTYITMVFSLSLATLVEYQGISGIIYGSVVPAVVATFLYSVALTVENSNPNAYISLLTSGFFLWLVLLVINVIRVIMEWRKRKSSTSSGDSK